jgi:hypothetical protein
MITFRWKPSHLQSKNKLRHIQLSNPIHFNYKACVRIIFFVPGETKMNRGAEVANSKKGVTWDQVGGRVDDSTAGQRMKNIIYDLWFI